MARAATQLITLGLLAAPMIYGNVVADLLNHLKPSGTSVLVASLRRQLMANNYDYMSIESDEFPSWPRTPPVPSELVNDMFVPRALEAPGPDDGPSVSEASDAASLVEFDSDAPPDGIAKNYMDDERDKRRSRGSGDTGTYEPAETNVVNEFESASPKAKYKVLKVPAAAGTASRRSGGRPYRRFLQEGAAGVAIINLDGEPFPEFRLPSARRQYMSDGDAADLEVASLTDLSDQMVNGFGEDI